MYVMLPSDVIVVKPRKSWREKLLLTSRHMQRRSVLALLPVWAYHHFVLAFSSGVLPQLALDSARSVVLFALGIGICGGSFGSFFIAPTVRRWRVLAALLLLGSIGISISGFSACTSGLCPQLCLAAACMGVSWGSLPGECGRHLYVFPLWRLFLRFSRMMLLLKTQSRLIFVCKAWPPRQ